jgi:hypothetical protein
MDLCVVLPLLRSHAICGISYLKMRVRFANMTFERSFHNFADRDLQEKLQSGILLSELFPIHIMQIIRVWRWRLHIFTFRRRSSHLHTVPLSVGLLGNLNICSKLFIINKEDRGLIILSLRVDFLNTKLLGKSLQVVVNQSSCYVVVLVALLTYPTSAVPGTLIAAFL